MPDFQLAPALTDLYTLVLSTLKDKDSALAKMDYAGWTNLPTGAIRSNAASSYKFERWNGSAWVALDFHTTIDSHIANTAIHQQPNIGSMQFIAYDTADSGWLLCDGQAVSRSTYSTLFTKIGTAYGAGDGSTTFNLPNLTGRLPIGLNSAVAALDTRGKTAGSWDHTHTTPAHQHTIASHTHGMKNHVHAGPSHSHTIADHSHSIPSHYHAATSNGGTINVTSSGAHRHELRQEAGGGGTSVGSASNIISLVGSTVTAYRNNNNTYTDGAHTHPASEITGTVGRTSGSNGDNAFTSGGSGILTTGLSGTDNTGAPNDNTTDGSGTLTTTAGEGSGTSGANNPPVLVGRWQIKF